MFSENQALTTSLSEQQKNSRKGLLVEHLINIESVILSPNLKIVLLDFQVYTLEECVRQSRR